jgi:hypothetical protein
MSNMNKYTNFIAEQVRRENTVGIRSKPISEAVDHSDMEDDNYLHVQTDCYKNPDNY